MIGTGDGIGEACVIEAEQVEQRGVKIMTARNLLLR